MMRRLFLMCCFSVFAANASDNIYIQGKSANYLYQKNISTDESETQCFIATMEDWSHAYECRLSIETASQVGDIVRITGPSAEELMSMKHDADAPVKCDTANRSCDLNGKGSF